MATAKSDAGTQLVAEARYWQTFDCVVKVQLPPLWSTQTPSQMTWHAVE
jgi:hypothetical protein